MKNLKMIFGFLAIAILSTLSFTTIKLGAIMGKVQPLEGVKSVYILSGADTLKTDLVQGTFKFSNLKEGIYTVVINSNEPYKDNRIENVAVKDSSTTDLGLIKLQQ